MAVTHGGKNKCKEFTWQMKDNVLHIRNENDEEHNYTSIEIMEIIRWLHYNFKKNWFPLGNNVEKLPAGKEVKGLGVAIFKLDSREKIYQNVNHAKGASYLGVVLEEIGILEWNGKKNGIKWKIIKNVNSANQLIHLLQNNVVSLQIDIDNLAQKVGQDAIKCVAPLRDEQFIDQCIKELSQNQVQVDFVSEAWTEKISPSYGVYLFWADLECIDNNIETLKNEWEISKKEIKYTPKFNKIRANKISELSGGNRKIPFYLGKAEDICSRIKQHTFLNAKSGTYALKLKAMRDVNPKIKEIDFYVSFIGLHFSKESAFLLELIESSIRNVLNPVIGRQ